jgi:hypothetical protein
MGLDTSHDCWHGPYSAFMRWRMWLHYFIMLDRGQAGDKECEERSHAGADVASLERAWNEGVYADQSVPLNVLMQHSDCDGEIAADVCGPLADALEDLANRRMPPRALYDEQRPATDRFIAGLRRAAASGETVKFH